MPTRTLYAALNPADPIPSPAQLDIAENLLTLLRDTTTEPRPDTQLEALTLADEAAWRQLAVAVGLLLDQA